MKNTFKNILRLVISLVLCLSFCITAVACGENDDDGSDVVPYTIIEPDTTHIRNVTETDTYFIKDGASDYTIILPSTQKTETNHVLAKDELNYFINKATGVTLLTGFDEIVNISTGEKTTLTHNDANKYISIGETKLFETSGITDAEFDKDSLVGDGCRIITKGNTVFLLGQIPRGLVNAAYFFLEEYFNYDFFDRSCYYIDKNVTSAKFLKMDIKEIPDILARTAFGSLPGNILFESSKATPTELTAGYTDYDYKNWVPRLKSYRSENDVVQKTMLTWRLHEGGARTYHNTHCYYDPKNHVLEDGFSGLPEGLTGWPKWFTDMPESEQRAMLDDAMQSWLATASEQFCYTARGNEKWFDLMAHWCAMKVERTMQFYTPAKYPQMNYATLSHEDTTVMCGCQACQDANTLDGGSYQGAIIRLCNAVMELVQEWQKRPENAEYYRPNMQLAFFSYGATVTPAARYDEEQQKYVPAHEDVVMRKDVACWVCNSDQEPYYYEENNKGRRFNEFANQMNYYGEYAGGVWFYGYPYGYTTMTEYVRDHVNFYNSDTYKVLAKNKTALCYFIAGGWSQPVYTQWGTLATYLHSKLSWDCTLSTQELIQKFFKNMYGDGAEYMIQAEQMLRLQYHSINEHCIANGLDNNTKKSLWNYTGFYKNYLNLFYNAVDAIAPLAKSNPAEYVLMKDRIQTEMAAPLFQTLYRFGDPNIMPFNNDTRRKYFNTLKEIADKWPNIAGMHTDTIADFIKNFA